MNKRILGIICFISVFVVSVAAINDKLFHADSYGTEFYGSNTSFGHTFVDVTSINWYAYSNTSSTIYISFIVSGAESCTEIFTLSNSYAFKNGSIGNLGSLSNYTISGSATCNNPPYGDQSIGRISFDAFIPGLN